MNFETIRSLEVREELVERFLRYVAVPSQSDAHATAVPSTEGQRELARLLVDELRGLGVEEVSLSPEAVVLARIPANSPRRLPAVGFVGHLDTVDVSLRPDIHPRRVLYQGGDLCLNPDEGIFLRTAEHSELARYIGQELLVTDGRSVLGADNKAAIACMITAVRHLLEGGSLPHGDLYFAFVPDEEIGLRGVRCLDLKRFPVDFAYTIDCCEVGEVVYETFNAASAHITIEGVSAHPMSARGVMLNPSLVAVDLANMLPRLETPENTSGREGYIWLQELHSNQSHAQVLLNIRDHDRERFQARKALIQGAVEQLRRLHPRARISLQIEDSYGNIADAVLPENRACIEHLLAAMRGLGIEPRIYAMRGGTDGSYLSAQGILTPNFFTGALNFHSYAEFLPIQSFELSFKTLLGLLAEIAGVE